MHFRATEGDYEWFDQSVMDNPNLNEDVFDLELQPMSSPDIWKHEELQFRTSNDEKQRLNGLFHTDSFDIFDLEDYPEIFSAILTLTRTQELWLTYRIPNTEIESHSVLILKSVRDFVKSNDILIANTDEGFKEIVFDWYRVKYDIRDLPYDYAFPIGVNSASFNVDGPLIYHSYYANLSIPPLFTAEEAKKFPRKEIFDKGSKNKITYSLNEYTISTIFNLIHVFSDSSLKILLLIRDNGLVEIVGDGISRSISLPTIAKEVLVSKVKSRKRGRVLVFNGYFIFADELRRYHILIFNEITHRIIPLEWPSGLSTSMRATGNAKSSLH